MNKGISGVRERIKHRKKQKLYDKEYVPTSLPLVATDEEKHGFTDISYGDIEQKEITSLKKRPFVLKNMFGSIFFFVVCYFILQTNLPFLQDVKNWLTTGMTEEFPFAKVNEWYASTLGSPLALTPESTPAQHGIANDVSKLPIDGIVTETFTSNGKGIMIAAKEATEVTTMKSGVVIFAGNNKHTEQTIVVQHADDSTTTYGFLSTIDVHLYEAVKANEKIGTFQPEDEANMVYFSIKQNDEFIDPAKVIPVVDYP